MEYVCALWCEIHVGIVKLSEIGREMCRTQASTTLSSEQLPKPFLKKMEGWDGEQGKSLLVALFCLIRSLIC